MLKCISAIAALTTALSVSAASAAVIEFTTGNSFQQGPIGFSGGGFSVGVSAINTLGGTQIAPPQSAAGPLIGSYAGYGLGVCSTGYSDTRDAYYSCTSDENGDIDDNAEGGDWTLIDGGAADGEQASNVNVVANPNDPDEMVIFDFGTEEVLLSSITFSLMGSDDDFDLAIFDGGSTATPASYSADVNFGADGRNGWYTYTFSAPVLVGTLFGIGADGASDEFLIASIEVSAVPLPAAGWMLLAGIAGLFGMKRRKTV